MATVRLIVVVLAVGFVVLLGAQNLAPALPLVFFGGSTQALPLGVWLVAAVLLGALTTLVFTALLGSVGGANRSRSAAYKYRPQSFYEPTGTPGPSPAASRAASDRPDPSPYTNPASRAASGRSPTTPSDRSRDGSADDDPSWRAWTDLSSPSQWNDWESLSRAPRPETAVTGSPAPGTASGIVDSVTTWFSSSKQRAKQQQRVNESMRELDDDWGNLENQPYRTPGVSPVQDSLDDITQGWDEPHSSRPHNPGFEAAQAPRRVYRDGSLYSYSYRDEVDAPPPRGQVDNIYAPPDDVSDFGRGPDSDYGGRGAEYASETVYGFSPDAAYDETYGADPDGDDSPLGAPELAEDGVVDADYRVIVPPYSPAAEAAATSDWGNSSADPTDSPDDDDDWNAADDALTP
ncbi:hypothetical protein [Leptolyngbya sp. KIOST-1]|uniref:hypothetical protein n=1 Tax=Leptolyngbya sp. KIOST-1 TaxID=1229172 RepID=UPI000559F32E|nr:hypothetical protein [Leptolyngbya sp. KIOST-1]